MAKYRLGAEGNIEDTVTGANIPVDERNEDYRRYQEWVAEGNTPDPVSTPPAKTDAELLYESDQQMIRAVDWLLQYLVANGVVQLADIPQQLKDLYLERKAQREAVGSPQV